MRVLIVGGGGYIGFHIGFELVARGHFVALFDLCSPNPIWFPDPTATTCPLPFVQGSILSLPQLEDALTQSRAEGVIHCASYGMSGSEQLPSAWDLTESVNINGTSLLLQACSSPSSEVTCLVYTSTYNVIFGDQEIIDGDETLPYFPLHRHWDVYSITKSVAERLVLVANGRGGKLSTCALRLAGVMGVGESRHLPRIVATLPMLKFRYGNAKVQFVSRENVVQAHVKALEKMGSGSEGSDKLGGQAYFISDGEAVDNFEYLRPLIEGLGYAYPNWVLPLWLMWIIVLGMQLVLRVVLWIRPGFRGHSPLLLSPAELLKTSVSHSFKVDKAWRDFDYVPERPNDLSGVVEEYRRKFGLPPLQ